MIGRSSCHLYTFQYSSWQIFRVQLFQICVILNHVITCIDAKQLDLVTCVVLVQDLIHSPSCAASVDIHFSSRDRVRNLSFNTNVILKPLAVLSFFFSFFLIHLTSSSLHPSSSSLFPPSWIEYTSSSQGKATCWPCSLPCNTFLSGLAHNNQVLPYSTSPGSFSSSTRSKHGATTRINYCHCAGPAL